MHSSQAPAYAIVLFLNLFTFSYQCDGTDKWVHENTFESKNFFVCPWQKYQAKKLQNLIKVSDKLMNFVSQFRRIYPDLSLSSCLSS